MTEHALSHNTITLPGFHGLRGHLSEAWDVLATMASGIAAAFRAQQASPIRLTQEDLALAMMGLSRRDLHRTTAHRPSPGEIEEMNGVLPKACKLCMPWARNQHESFAAS